MKNRKNNAMEQENNEENEKVKKKILKNNWKIDGREK